MPDLDLLASFVAVADAHSFSRAATRLGRSQSTISEQIRKLEQRLGKTLLERSPQLVRLTPDGETVLVHARRMLSLAEELEASVGRDPLVGTVRLGTPEDFATTHLPDILADFSHAHPGVALEVTCDLTLTLLDGFRRGSFDLVLLKREPSGLEEGLRVWREPLVWVARSGEALPPPGQPLALVASPPPCVYRKRATQALDRAGRSWRVAYSCASLAGALAAVRAGLGVAVLPKEMAPRDLAILDTGDRLPDLSDTEIALLEARSISRPAQRLRDHIVRRMERET